MRLIYDGNNVAYRNNVVTELYTKDGERTSAIYGTLNSIKKDVPEVEKFMKTKTNEVIFVWDFGKSKRRLDWFPEYKSNRAKDKTEDEKLWFEEFLEQANFLHENLHHFGVKSFKVKGWEADDLAYAFTKEITAKTDEKVVLISTDEDWLQMINEKVSVYSPVKGKWITEENFEEVVGIPRELFVQYKAIKGDDSDGIPGIDGIGEKTGKQLINEHNGIQGILENQDTLMKSKRFQKIFTEENRRLIHRNLRLIDLEYVNYDELKEAIGDTIEEFVELNEKQAMNILKSKQFVSILTQYKKWIGIFQGLNGNSLG